MVARGHVGVGKGGIMGFWLVVNSGRGGGTGKREQWRLVWAGKMVITGVCVLSGGKGKKTMNSGSWCLGGKHGRDVQYYEQGVSLGNWQK
ncbi:hypothetical protein Tco_0579365 [Tanacetum coccineum]